MSPIEGVQNRDRKQNFATAGNRTLGLIIQGKKKDIILDSNRQCTTFNRSDNFCLFFYKLIFILVLKYYF